MCGTLCETHTRFETKYCKFHHPVSNLMLKLIKIFRVVRCLPGPSIRRSRHITTVLSKNDTQVQTTILKSIPNFRIKCENLYPISGQNVTIFFQFQIKMSKSIPNFRSKCQNLSQFQIKNGSKTLYPMALHLPL